MSQLFLVQKFKTLIQVLNYCNLFRIFLNYDHRIPFILSVFIKIKHFCFFHMLILLCCSMNITRYYCLKVPNMILSRIYIYFIIQPFFICLYKVVGHISFHLIWWLFHNYFIFWFKKLFTLSLFKKAKSWDL